MLKDEYDTLPLTTGVLKGHGFVIIPVYKDKDAVNCTFYVRYNVM